MNLDLINRGVSPNDGTGDTLRDGAEKINDNFLKLLAAHASQTGNPAGGLNANDVLPGMRPDNPSDRSEGGTDFGVTVAALAGAVLGNISVIENANGTSIRIPETRIQLAIKAATIDIGVGTWQAFVFPQAFAEILYISPPTLREYNGSTYVFAASEAERVTSIAQSATLGGISFSVRATKIGDTASIGSLVIGRY